jgi:hypothetical protein
VTPHPDSVPDSGPLNFKLWLPRWDTHHGRLRCRFQATSAGLTQLKDGTAECMSRFLAELGHGGAEDITWLSERYRTPFFSDFPDADEWEDRLAMAWDVRIETDNLADPEDAGTHAPGPHGSHAYDTTFVDEDEDWERARERVLVIVGTPYGPQIDPTPLETVEGVLAAKVGIFEGMVALDLGVLDLPDDTLLIDAVLARCREQGMRTHWQEPGGMISP